MPRIPRGQVATTAKDQYVPKCRSYCLIGPSGKARGLYASRWEAWVSAFDFQNDFFRAKYWKRIEPSRRAMRKLGWRVVEGYWSANVKKLKRTNK